MDKYTTLFSNPDAGTFARLEGCSTRAFEALRKLQAIDLISPFDKVDLEAWLCPCPDATTIGDLQSVIFGLQDDLELAADSSDEETLKAGSRALSTTNGLDKMVGKLEKVLHPLSFDQEKFNADLHNPDAMLKRVRLAYERAHFVVVGRTVVLEAVAKFHELGISTRRETREYLEQLGILKS